MIAVLGASGGVGRVATANLSAAGHSLRLGARDPGVLGGLAGGRQDCERIVVDATDPSQLRAFCRGAQVVLGAAGPSHALGPAMLMAARKAGAHYVDPGGDEPLHRVAADRPRGTEEEAVVLSAGMLPGLSGLVARHTADTRGGRPHRLVLHAGGLYRFTPAAAADFVAAGADTARGIVGMGWRHGARVPLPLIEDVMLPAVHHPVTAWPHLSGEMQRLAQALDLDEAESYTVLDGAATTAAVRDAMRLTAHRLQRVTEADSAGRTPYVLMVARVYDAETVREVVLRGHDAGALTGAVAALTASAVAADQVPPGVHYAADVLDPAAILTALRRQDAMAVVTDTRSPLLTEHGLEEGAL